MTRVIPRRIAFTVPLEKVKDDLIRYRSMIFDMGASDVKIIRAREIKIEERVRAKCLFPKCSQYGTNANCPPYVPDIPFVRKFVRSYENAILFCVKSQAEDYVGKGYKKKIPQAKRVHESIIQEIESRAFYDGYYFAVAFGQGSCKSLYCQHEPCAVLDGSGCRFPLKARSSMEAIGIDVFNICAKYGWEVYPCGRRLEKDDIPHILLVGLILIH